jgi:hypothetical protein
MQRERLRNEAREAAEELCSVKRSGRFGHQEFWRCGELLAYINTHGVLMMWGKGAYFVPVPGRKMRAFIAEAQ